MTGPHDTDHQHGTDDPYDPYDRLAEVGRGAVVVGSDGSDRARRAARWAAGEAADRGLRLVVVAVLRGPFPEVVVTSGSVPLPRLVGEESVRAYADDHLAEVAAECRRVAPGLDVDAHALDGHPAAVLDEVGRDAALLVVGSSGTTGLARAFTGSVAADLAHRFRCRRPGGHLVVVRGHDAADDRVVVGVDGSGPGDRAVDVAAEFAARHGHVLVAVHATAGPPVESLAAGGAWAQGLGPALDTEQLRDAAEDLVREALAGPLARHPGLRVERVVSPVAPARLLLDQAERAALLVVGSHGHGAVRRALLGSVGHAVLHHAPCPLALVRNDVATTTGRWW